VRCQIKPPRHFPRAAVLNRRQHVPTTSATFVVSPVAATSIDPFVVFLPNLHPSLPPRSPPFSAQ
jgi:hypothetical protein